MGSGWMPLRKPTSQRLLGIGVIVVVICVGQIALAQNQQTISAPTPPASQSQIVGSRPNQLQEAGNQGETANVGQIIEIENEIAETRAQIRSLVRLSSLITVFLQTKDTFSKAFDDAKDVDCKTNAARLHSDFDSIQNTIVDWYAISQGMREQGKVLKPFLAEWWQANDERKCEALQNANLRQQGLSGFNEIEADAKQNSEDIEKLTRDISHLYAQRDEAIGSQTTIRSITAALPYILAIIAGFAIMIMIFIFTVMTYKWNGLHQAR